MSSFDIELVKLNELMITNAAIENKTQLIQLEKGQFSHTLKFQFQAAVNITAKTVRIIFLCNIDTLDKNNESLDVKGLFEIAYIFNVQNLEDLIQPPAEDLNLEQELLLSLSNIVYSTSRGVIYTRCQGTILKHLILPIIPTHKLSALLSQN